MNIKNRQPRGTNQQLYKEWAKSIFEKETEQDRINQGLVIQQIIKEKNDNPIKTDHHFVNTRKELQQLGMSSEQANRILFRTQEMIQQAIKSQKQKQVQNAEIGLQRIPYFNHRLLRKRIDTLDFKAKPTLDNLIDIMLLFCMRTTEYKSLKLHLQPDKKTYKISGYTKSKDSNEQRDFISIYPPSKIKYLVKVLNWIQSNIPLLQQLIGINNQLLNKYLQEKYKINASLLRKYGVDLILQKMKPKNPSNAINVVQKATRHVQSPSADLAYCIVNN